MKFLVLLALVGLSIAAPAVDYGGSTVKPVQGVQGQTGHLGQQGQTGHLGQQGHVYALPAGAIPVTNNIQSLPNQNIPLTGNQIGQPILGQPIGQPIIAQPNLLKNEGQPLDTPLLNNSQVLLPYLQQQNFGYPWLHLQQNPHMMALYHMWLQQHQLQMFNWYNQLLFQQWMGQNHQMFNQFNQGQLPFGQFNQGSQLPIGSQIGLNQGSFGGVSLPNQDLLNGRASPILIQNPLYTLPTTTTTRLVTPFRNQNLIGTPWTYPIRTQFRAPIRHNVFPYEYGMNNGYYGQYPYGGGYNPYLYGMQGYQSFQPYQSYPYFGGFGGNGMGGNGMGGNGMGGNGIFLDNQIQNTASNAVPTDTLTNNQPIVNQPTI